MSKFCWSSFKIEKTIWIKSLQSNIDHINHGLFQNLFLLKFTILKYRAWPSQIKARLKSRLFFSIKECIKDENKIVNAVGKLDCKYSYEQKTCPETSSQSQPPYVIQRQCSVYGQAGGCTSTLLLEVIPEVKSGIPGSCLIFRVEQIIKLIIQICMYFQKNSHYGKQTFWEKRYAENCTEFDWYQNWANLRDIISQFIRYDSKILNVGAGNSPFSEAMYAEGYKYITNIDFSEIVVEDMQLKYKNNAYEPTIKYQLGDVRSMKEFENQTFDCVIDKGMLDSILCGSYSKQNSKKMLREISRVLKNKGVYICVSYGDPDIRNHYFQDKSQKYDWGKKNQWPYKIFKPTIQQSQKELVFNDKDKQKNKDYYHYVYVLGKGEDSHLGQLQGQAKSSNAMINSSNVMR